MENALRSPHFLIGVIHLEDAALDPTCRIGHAIASHINRKHFVSSIDKFADDAGAQESISTRH